MTNLRIVCGYLNNLRNFNRLLITISGLSELIHKATIDSSSLKMQYFDVYTINKLLTRKMNAETSQLGLIFRACFHLSMHLHSVLPTYQTKLNRNLEKYG